MKKAALLLALVLGIFYADTTRGKDIYISQSGAGGNNGQDAGDAYSLTWLNNSANWGNGGSQVDPGDTVHLLGTFTTPLIVAGNGGVNNPVTIYFEPGANFSSPCWSPLGAIELNGVSWITIDGGQNGVIQNTANGTGLANQSNSRGIGGGGSGSGPLYNGVIKNLTITNIYRNIPGDANRLGYPMDLVGSSIIVSNCNLSDGDAVVSFSANGANATNIFFVNNRILNFNHGFFLGVNPNSLITNLVVAGNLIDHSDLWDEPSGAHHLDDIIIANDATNASALITGLYIYQNIFGPHFGVHNTAAIYNGMSNPRYQLANIFVYNNLFLSTGNSWGNGFAGPSGSNVWVVNNTMYGFNGSGSYCGGGAGVGGVSGYLMNNIMMGGSGDGMSSFTPDSVSGSQQGVNDVAVVNTYLTQVWCDYNVIAGTASPNFSMIVASTLTGNLMWLSGIFGSLHDWQTWYENEWGSGQVSSCCPGLTAFAQQHCDPHSSSTVPQMITGLYGLTYVPSTNDSVTATGTNLTFLGITNDFFGNPRPATGNWTIGAIQVTYSGNSGGGNTNTSGGGNTNTNSGGGNTNTNSGGGNTNTNTGGGTSGTPTVSLIATTTLATNGTWVTLTWSSSNATNVTLSQIGPVALSGSTNVLAGNTISYTATATGPGGASSTNTSIPSPPTNFRLIPQSP